MSDIGTQIFKFIKKQTEDIVENVCNPLLNDAAKKCVLELQKRSPKKTGNYALAWKYRKFKTDDLTDRDSYSIAAMCNAYVVHNTDERGEIKSFRNGNARSDGRNLTNVLEYGHVNARGGKFVNGIPHIDPVREEIEEELLHNLKGALH